MSRRKAGGAAGERAGPGDDLIGRCIAGEAGAWSELYAAHRRRVAADLAGLLGDRDQLEARIEEVFVTAFRELAGGDDPGDVGLWLERITVRVALAALERGVEPGAGEVAAALSRLSPRARLAVQLRELEGREVDAIAGLLGVRPLAVRARLGRARRELYGRLAGSPGWSFRHVAPSLWGDHLAGRLPRGRAHVIEQHAGSCRRCRDQRQRIEEAIAEHDAIGAEVPDLSWDHIGARIYWTSSLERRSPAPDREGRRGRRALVAALAALIAIAAIGWSASGRGRLIAPVEAAGSEPLAVELAPAEALSAIAVLARGAVAVDGRPLAWDRPIEGGARIRTGDGEVVIQFGRDSGFALGPGSAVTLRSFDSQLVELVLEAGSIDVRVGQGADRPPQLAVISKQRSVLARGAAAFRVGRPDGRLEVSFNEGELEISDGLRSSRLSPRGSAGQAALLLLPAWSDAGAALSSSASVAIEAGPEDRIAIDGIELGAGGLTVRLPVGRHRIEIADRGEWLAINQGEKIHRIDANPASPRPN